MAGEKFIIERPKTYDEFGVSGSQIFRQEAVQFLLFNRQVACMPSHAREK